MMDTNLLVNQADVSGLTIDVNVVLAFCGRLVNGEKNAIITFQTFDDRKDEGVTKNDGLARIFHCSLGRLKHQIESQINPLVQQGAGFYVMVNQGDGKGRKSKNVTEIRAVFVDLDENGVVALQKIEERVDIPKPHIVVETSPGKFHVYWFVNNMSLSNFKSVQEALIEKCGGDPCVTDLPRVLRLPGSIHQKNEPFRVKIISDHPSPPYPAEVFTKLLNKQKEDNFSQVIDPDFEALMDQAEARKIPIEQLKSMLQHIDLADDYDRWIKVGMALYPVGDEGFNLWSVWSSQARNYDEKVCKSKWQTFKKYSGNKIGMRTIYYLAKKGGWVPPGGGEPLTDAGNAQRLVRIFGLEIRYCPEHKKWLIWDGVRWLYDKDGVLTQLAIQSVRQLAEEAKSDEDSDRRRRRIRWALNSESRQRIEAAIILAKSVKGITIHPDELDADPMLLNVENGTIDLRTGKIKPHSRTDYITNLVQITYPENIIVSLTWYHFLNEIFGGDDDLIKYVQRVVGYCLTGDIREQCLFFLFGMGANGKTTFINVISLLLGSYAIQTATETFMIKQNSGGATPELAILDGKRVVTANETEEGKRLAEATIKQLCGGDQITARPLYCEPFNFFPQFKILIAGNHKPQIRGNDHGIWRRIHLIPFNATIPPEKQNKHLAEQLREELPAILQWAIDGCLMWQKEGLSPPPVVTNAVAEYRETMDTIGQWLDECCIYGPSYTTKSSLLYSSYKMWATNAGHAPMSQRRLGESLRMKGLKNIKYQGDRCWEGIGIKASSHMGLNSAMP